MLKELRKKPKYVRNQYAFFGATTLTGIVALIWLVSLPVRFGEAVVTSDTDVRAVGAFSQFFSDAKNSVSSVISTVSERIPNGDDVQTTVLSDTQSESTEEDVSTTTQTVIKSPFVFASSSDTTVVPTEVTVPIVGRPALIESQSAFDARGTSTEEFEL